MALNTLLAHGGTPESLIGVDEAGRGPVLGPLVVVGVRTRDDGPLREIGVRDSKKCTPELRERLGPQIRRFCEHVVVRTIPAERIDSVRAVMTLNELEAEVFADVIRGLLTSKFPAGRTPGSIRVYVDAADANAQAFKENVLRHLGVRVDLISEHKADDTYPVVSAASILAKLIRDEEMGRISKEVGRDVGSGYPSDPVTMAYIERTIRENGVLPPHTRKSWETVQRFLRKDRKLTDFEDPDKNMER
jgi:ribonuclease HII